MVRLIGFGLVISGCVVVRIFCVISRFAARSARGATRGRGLGLGFLDAGSNDVAQFLEVLTVQFEVVTRRIVLRRISRETVFGEEIAVGNVGFVDGFSAFFGAVKVAQVFEGFVGFTFEPLGMVFFAKFFGGLVAVFLEDMNLASQSAEDANGASEFFGFGFELLSGFGLEEELGEFGGDELEADFGELGGVVGAEVSEEIVLKEPGFEGAILSDAPITITTSSFPVGDVAFGDFELEFTECIDDLGMRNVVAEHAVDHVAGFEGKAGDFAVAGAGLDTGCRMLDARYWILDAGFWMGSRRERGMG